MLNVGKFFSFNGRSSRKEFVSGILRCLLISLGISFLVFILGYFFILSIKDPFGATMIYISLLLGICILFYLLFFLSSSSFFIRRLHDLNLSGFWVIIFHLPVIFWFFSEFPEYVGVGLHNFFKENLEYFTNVSILVSVISLLILIFIQGRSGENKYDNDSLLK